MKQQTLKRIKPEIIEQVKKDPAIIGTIAKKCNRGIRTVENWVSAVDQGGLSDINALGVISDFLRIPIDKLTEEVPA